VGVVEWLAVAVAGWFLAALPLALATGRLLARRSRTYPVVAGSARADRRAGLGAGHRTAPVLADSAAR
jgi:hypothetical protein